MRLGASLAFAVALTGVLAGAQDLGPWNENGRATFYGADAWSIHKGACGMGYIWPDRATGWDVAAIADASPEFNGSCGRCYEVKCRPAVVVDGYDDTIDRSDGICRDTSQSIVVRATDNCPCKYPGNEYSNKRWCCHDHGMQHFDLSIWAFEKLARSTQDFGILNIGIIGVSWRRVPCSYRPPNQALPLDRPTPGENPSSNTSRPDQGFWVPRVDAAGARQGAVQRVFDHKSATSMNRGLVNASSLCQGGGCDMPHPDPSVGGKFAPATMDDKPLAAPSATPSAPAAGPGASQAGGAPSGQPPRQLTDMLRHYMASGAATVGFASDGDSAPQQRPYAAAGAAGQQAALPGGQPAGPTAKPNAQPADPGPPPRAEPAAPQPSPFSAPAPAPPTPAPAAAASRPSPGPAPSSEASQQRRWDYAGGGPPARPAASSPPPTVSPPQVAPAAPPPSPPPAVAAATSSPPAPSPLPPPSRPPATPSPPSPKEQQLMPGAAEMASLASTLSAATQQAQQGTPPPPPTKGAPIEYAG